MKRKYIIVTIIFMLIISTGLIAHQFLLTKSEPTVVYNNPYEQAFFSLISKQKANGLFPYEFDFNKEKYTEIDNIIHQTEIALVMLDYLNDNPNDQTIKHSLVKLLNGLVDRLDYKDHGLQLSYPSFDGKQEKEKQRAEISATAILTAALIKYRNLFNDLTFSTTETYLIQTLIEVTKFIKKREDILSPLITYPNYEVWYALTLYSANQTSDKKAKKALAFLDRFFPSARTMIEDNDSLLYFIKTGQDRYKATKSPYIAGALLRNIRYFIKNYSNQYNSQKLSCLKVAILSQSLKALKQMSANKPLYGIIENRITKGKEDSLKFLISQGQEWISTGHGKSLDSPEIKKFTGFFISGYGNPITTVKNSVDCIVVFKDYEK